MVIFLKEPCKRFYLIIVKNLKVIKMIYGRYFGLRDSDIFPCLDPGGQEFPDPQDHNTEMLERSISSSPADIPYRKMKKEIPTWVNFNGVFQMNPFKDCTRRGPTSTSWRRTPSRRSRGSTSATWSSCSRHVNTIELYSHKQTHQ